MIHKVEVKKKNDLEQMINEAEETKIPRPSNERGR